MNMNRFNFYSLLFPLSWAVAVFAGQTATGDESILAKEAARANNQSLLWGPYKSNLYFGVRPRIPDSLFAGLLWAKVDDFATAQQSMFRYTIHRTFQLSLQPWVLHVNSLTD